jgi:NADPH-dependent 2,4-dienoyl-CoA reductase/sulfur reductase-like enzyme
LAGIHTVRTRADVDAIRAELGAAQRIAVIGGGYIGLETAAVLVKASKQVTLFESFDRVLARVAGEPLSRFFEAEHRANGVDVRLGVSVERFEGAGRVAGIGLADGTVVPCDMAIVGTPMIRRQLSPRPSPAGMLSMIRCLGSGRTNMTFACRPSGCRPVMTKPHYAAIRRSAVSRWSI